MESRDFLNYLEPSYIPLVMGVTEVLRILVYSPRVWWWNKANYITWSGGCALFAAQLYSLWSDSSYSFHLYLWEATVYS